MLSHPNALLAHSLFSDFPDFLLSAAHNTAKSRFCDAPMLILSFFTGPAYFFYFLCVCQINESACNSRTTTTTTNKQMPQL